jgi:hypothetical protein
MLRAPTLVSQALPRLLTLAIAVVVGFQLGPQFSAPSASTPLIGSADQKVSEAAFQVGERFERRALQAPFLDRLSPVRASCGLGAVPDADEVFAVGDLASDGRPDHERLPAVKHVPRMERGDPPRT